MGRSAAAEADRTSVSDMLFFTRRHPTDKGSDDHERHTLPEVQRQGGTKHQRAEQTGQHRGKVGTDRKNCHAPLLYAVSPHGIGAAKHTAPRYAKQKTIPCRSGSLKTAGNKDAGKNERVKPENNRSRILAIPPGAAR